MAHSSSSTADGLLASARETADQGGLRLAVPQFVEAVDALVADGRTAEAQGVLAELLSAKGKVRGFFLGKREQSALGNQRATVANKFACVAKDATPTEKSLDVLNGLALEFPGDFDVRLANAEALRHAGYLLDSLDEFKHVQSMRAGVPDVDIRAADVYAQLGRFDDAADALSTMDGDAVAQRRQAFDTIVSAFARSDGSNVAARRSTAGDFATTFEKLITRDPLDASLWQSLTDLDPNVASEVRARLTDAAMPATNGSLAVVAPASDGSEAPSQAAKPPRRASASALASFGKRRALELFADGHFEQASAQLERVISMAPDREALEMLLECYLALDRHDEAARIGVRLADAEVAAGNKPGAIATLTSLSKKIADPTVEQRRVELMQKS